MSSILKALKKLETESPDKNDIRSLPALRRKAKPSWHRVKGDRVVYPGIIILSLVLFLAGGTWFLFGRTSREISPKPAATPETKPEKAIAAPEKKTVPQDWLRKKRIARQAVQQQEPEEIAVSVLQKSPFMEKTLPDTEEGDIESGAAADFSDESAPMAEPEQDNAFSKSYMKGYERAEPSDPFASLPVKDEDESGLKLQAIAWSEDPGRRIAVVNNRVVREGGSVEDAFVTHIGENAVGFRKGGEKWQQIFRIK
ncbi:MAG: hypothetical protein ABII68_00515 [Pseudomonadota bacterium]